jgi:hypothetical protein
MSVIAVATATFYRDPADVRVTMALETFEALVAAGHPVVCVDGGSPTKIVQQFIDLGVIVLPEGGRSMGAGRRLALAQAGHMAGPDGVVVWMEPEKLPFVQFLSEVAEPIFAGLADLVIPKRSSMHTYPHEQQHAEALGNATVYNLTGRHWDFWFGPKVMNQRALQLFLDYEGKYGDKWDAIMIPSLRAIASSDYRVRSVEVNYLHPKGQTEQEEGNNNFVMHRVGQLANIVPAITQEAVELGIYDIPIN